MRLWHIDLIEYLPDLQLIAQWRELNSIYTNQPNHILINYVYEYSKDYLRAYSDKVLKEMRKRNFKIRSLDKYRLYFGTTTNYKYIGLRYPEHNDECMKICFHNLKEKYIRGQKDFSDLLFEKLSDRTLSCGGNCGNF